LHGVRSVDKVWKTCCTMHNWLLDIDGLLQNWENGVPSEWKRPMGQHSASTVRQYATPLVLSNLHTDKQIHNFDLSDAIAALHSQTFNNDDDHHDNGDSTVQESVEATANGDQCVVTRHLKLKDFRASLVEHYTIMSTQNKVQWPERNHSRQI